MKEFKIGLKNVEYCNIYIWYIYIYEGFGMVAISAHLSSWFGSCIFSEQSSGCIQHVPCFLG